MLPTSIEIQAELLLPSSRWKLTRFSLQFLVTTRFIWEQILSSTFSPARLNPVGAVSKLLFPALLRGSKSIRPPIASYFNFVLLEHNNLKLKRVVMSKIMLLAFLSLGTVSAAFADSSGSLDCSKNITCNYHEDLTLMTCTDGTIQDLCYLAPPASGVTFVCDCNIVCNFPNNDLNSPDWKCSTTTSSAD